MTTGLQKPRPNLLRLYYEPKLRDIARAFMDPPRGITQIRGRLCEHNTGGWINKKVVSAAGLLRYHYKYAYYDSERYFWIIYCSVDVCNYHTFGKSGNLTAYITHLNDDHLMSFYEIGESVLKLIDLLPTTPD
jgi:hypothetical protein